MFNLVLLILLSLFGRVYSVNPLYQNEVDLLSDRYINLVTGEFEQARQDLIRGGDDPIILERLFTTDGGENGGRWVLLSKLQLTKETNGSGQTLYYEVPMLSNGTTCFHKDGFPMMHPQTMNLFFPGMEGKHHPLNMSGEFGDQEIIITYGDGTTRVYKLLIKSNSRSICYHLIEEETSRGKRLRYAYDKKGNLSEIQLIGLDGESVIDQIVVHYSENESSRRMTFKGKQSRPVTYVFTKWKKKEYLEQVIDHLGREEKYVYHWDQWRKYNYLQTIIYPNQASLHIRYMDADGKVWCAGVHPEGGDKLARWTRKKDGALECYNWRRENSLITYDSVGRIAQIESAGLRLELLWNREGCLTEKKYLDASDNPIFSRSFTYDLHRNVIAEEVKGIDGSENMTYFYDGSNREVKRIHSNGLELQTEYFRNTALKKGILTLIHGTIVHREFWNYDKNGDLYEHITDDGASHVREQLDGVIVRRITRYTRNNGILVEITRHAWNRETKGEVLLEREKLFYNGHGEVIKKTHLNSLSQVLWQEEWFYNIAGQLAKYTHSVEGETSFIYDNFGRLIEEKKNDLTHEYIYNGAGLVEKKRSVDTRGQEQWERFVYDQEGRLTAKEDHEGRICAYSYDQFDRCIKNEEGAYTFDVYGNTASTTNLDGHTTKIIKGVLSIPIETHYPDHTIVKTTLQKGGLVITITDQMGFLTQETRDPLGRLLEKQVGERIWKYCYIRSVLDHEVNPEGEVTQYQYDGLGRVIHKIGPSLEEGFSYNEEGRISAHKLNGKVERFIYDSVGRVIEKRTGCQIEGFTYDSEGRRTSHSLGNTSNCTTVYCCYDGWGRVVRMLDARGSETKIRYGSRFKETIDPLGRICQEWFDDRNNLIEWCCLDENGRVVQREEIEYSKGGLKLQQKSLLEKTIVEHEYDAMQREIIRREKKNDQEVLVRFAYNPKGELIKLTKEDGVVIHHDYNQYGEEIRLRSSDRSVDYTYTYDGVGRCTAVQNQINGEKIKREYEDGQLKREVWGPNLWIDYTFRSHRLRFITLPDHSRIGYEYDEGGCRAVWREDPNQQKLYEHEYMVDEKGMVFVELLIKGLGECTYTHDLDGMTMAVKSPYHDARVTERDRLGNVTKIKPIEFRYDALNQLIKEGEHGYTWNSHLEAEDIERDRAGRWLGSDLTRISYDALDRVTLVTTPRGVIRYGYDGFNRLIWREEQGTREELLYKDDIEIGVFSEGQLVQLRVLGIGKGEDIGGGVAIEIAKNLYCPLYDPFGSVTALVDTQTKQVVEQYSYSAFGLESITDGYGNYIGGSKIGNPWRFHSKRCEGDSELVIYPKRWYSPEKKSFVQKDPLGCDKVPNYHHFNYNNPYRFLDPLGLLAELHPIKHSIPSKLSYYIRPYSFSVGSHLAYYLIRSLLEDEQDWRVRETDILSYGEAKNDHRSFLFVNGINYMPDDIKQIGSWMAEGLNRQVHCIHNPQQGLIGDLTRSLLHYMGIKTDIVLGVRDHIRKEILQGKTEISAFGHSEGNMILTLALKELSREERNHVTVYAFGSPYRLNQHIAKEIHQFVAEKDYVHVFCDRYRMGYRGCDAPVQILPSNKKMFDHSLFQDTYKSKLQEVISSIQETYSK